MLHNLQSKDKKFKFSVEMGCNHPEMEGNSAESVGCSGKCECCNYSIASLTIPEMMELLKRAECTKLQ